MQKARNLIVFLCLVAVFVYVGTVVADRQELQEHIICLQVTGPSQESLDMTQFNAIVQARMQSLLLQLSEPGQAAAYIRQKLPEIQREIVQLLGDEQTQPEAAVRFCRENIGTGKYPHHQVPAGVYSCLCITVGDGGGERHSWVLYPVFQEDAAVEASAMDAGLSRPAAEAIVPHRGFDLRFWIMDTMGKVENFFFKG